MGALQFCGVALRLCGGVDIKLTKTPLMCSASRFNLGGLGALFEGDKPIKAPPLGDGTGCEQSDCLTIVVKHLPILGKFTLCA